MFDYNKKSIIILGSVIICGVISYSIYQKKPIIKKPIIKQPIIKKPIIKKPIIKKQLTYNETINLFNAIVKVNHTKKLTMSKSCTPINFSLQQTKKVTSQIVLHQIKNETHTPNKVKHNTILKFLDNNINIDLSECDTKHNDISDGDNTIIIMARS
jgi:hypothetical protein